MIGGGHLIYIFPGIHFEPNSFPPLTLNQFLKSSKGHIGTNKISKICTKFNKASNDISIMLCCISKIGVICRLNASFLVYFLFLISLVFYIKINIKKIQIYFSKFNAYTLIINYISKSCFSLSKKDLKIGKFRLRCTPCRFSKNARILTVIFIGHRQLDNNFFFIYPLLHTPLHLLFIQQLLDILYSFKENKRKQIDIMS
jgi:hypothetical protein